MNKIAKRLAKRRAQRERRRLREEIIPRFGSLSGRHTQKGPPLQHLPPRTELGGELHALLNPIPPVEYVTWKAVIDPSELEHNAAAVIDPLELEHTFGATIECNHRARRRGRRYAERFAGLAQLFSLQRRVLYGGKKGRSAARKLRRLGVGLDEANTMHFSNAWSSWGGI